MVMTRMERPYTPSENRYDGVMPCRRCGDSGLMLPSLSLGFWWNFGGINPLAESREKILAAFDSGIFCFDLANNYGPPYGYAERTFGEVYDRDLRPYRHEMVVTTKAGYDMWPGPNGIGSSRKMLFTSIDESLKRMKLDYVDIFYSHRYDGVTPIEETMQALIDIVRSGRALYAGLSNYPMDKLEKASSYLKSHDCPCIIYQGRYNMNVRDVETAQLPFAKSQGIGFTAFSPLAQGLLTDKYLGGIPSDSRAANGRYLTEASVTHELVECARQLDFIASQRGQTLAQMAVSWLLAQDGVTSVIIGPRTIGQLNDLVRAVDNTAFTDDEMAAIDCILSGKDSL